MGWLFTYGQSKQELIEKRVRKEENENGIWEYPEHALKGKCLWKILYHTNKQTGESTKIICLDLIEAQYDKNSKGKKEFYGYGYKDMDETMGPCYYDCPLSFLEKVPCPNSNYAPAWRKKVIEYHAQSKMQKETYSSLAIGKTYSLIHASIPQITIVGKIKRSFIGEYQGKRYRIPKHMIGTERR